MEQPAGAGLRLRAFAFAFYIFALLAQILAPAAAALAMANRSPLDNAPICDKSGPINPTHPGDHKSDCPCCTLCAVAHASYLPASDEPVSVAAPMRAAQKLVFTSFVFDAPARAPPSDARPRAPPSFL